MDNFSLSSSTDLSQLNATSNNLAKSAEIVKVLKSFTLLEKEFSVDGGLSNTTNTKLDECLIKLQPPVSFQDDTKRLVKPVEPTHSDGQLYENVVVNAKEYDQPEMAYENVLITTKPTQRTYENVHVKRQQTPPTPLPRQQVGPSELTNGVQIPLPRNRTNSKSLGGDFDEIHDCKVVMDNGPKDDSDSELPRLINFLPKANYDEHIDNVVVKKCVKISSSDNVDDDNFEDSSSSSSDGDVEKVYEPGVAIEKRDSSDAFSDEEGEKLGPPDIINGPGPSEAYFNSYWSPNLLPTIGEVEEEFSSLEPQTTG